MPNCQPQETENDNGSSKNLLILMNVVAAAALIGIFYVAKQKNTPRISMDAIRKIYDGLAPEDTD